mmetsp:Transcript_4754/g.10639  ORF Transcript_4754/g.10639 Transcript_4754/m.10639 type:complete len:415 (+) Transcript_4754:375-1619(+)
MPGGLSPRSAGSDRHWRQRCRLADPPRPVRLGTRRCFGRGRNRRLECSHERTGRDSSRRLFRWKEFLEPRNGQFPTEGIRIHQEGWIRKIPGHRRRSQRKRTLSDLRGFLPSRSGRLGFLQRPSQEQVPVGSHLRISERLPGLPRGRLLLVPRPSVPRQERRLRLSRLREAKPQRQHGSVLDRRKRQGLSVSRRRNRERPPLPRVFLGHRRVGLRRQLERTVEQPLLRQFVRSHVPARVRRIAHERSEDPRLATHVRVRRRYGPRGPCRLHGDRRPHRLHHLPRPGHQDTGGRKCPRYLRSGLPAVRGIRLRRGLRTRGLRGRPQGTGTEAIQERPGRLCLPPVPREEDRRGPHERDRGHHHRFEKIGHPQERKETGRSLPGGLRGTISGKRIQGSHDGVYGNLKQQQLCNNLA